MEETYISISEFCEREQLEVSFVSALIEEGMVTITEVNETVCIYEEEIPRIRKFSRLHDELEINVQGIDTIANLLDRIELLEHEVLQLRARVKRFEREL